MAASDGDSSPLPRTRKPLPPSVNNALSPPVDPRIKRVTRSPAGADSVVPKSPLRTRKDKIFNHPLLDMQAEEDSRESLTPNSSDDGDESDLSCVSHTNHHSNAPKHVYLQSLSSQGGFPAPLHRTRNRFGSTVGTCPKPEPWPQPQPSPANSRPHNFAESIEERIRIRKEEKRAARQHAATNDVMGKCW